MLSLSILAMSNAFGSLMGPVLTRLVTAQMTTGRKNQHAIVVRIDATTQKIDRIAHETRMESSSG
jgi:hypothetical protein